MTTQANLPRMAAVIVAACAAFWGSGCARSTATTAVHPDGSWVRTVTFHGSKPAKDGSNFGTPLSEAFVLPSGTEWKITHADTKDDAVVVAERTLQPGEILKGDITVKGGKQQPQPVAANTVTVRKIAPGVFEYKETLHWQGPMPKGLTPDAEMVAIFKKSLPPTLATDANARDLATQTVKDLWRVLFGPGDPLISQFSALLLQPDLMEQRLQQRIGAVVEKHIETKFGDQVTVPQRRAIARSIVRNSLFKMTNETKNSGPGGGGGEQPSTDKDNSGPLSPSLFIRVKLPGRITATNGERDEVENETYWALYPDAAALGDVTLTATCDTNSAN